MVSHCGSDLETDGRSGRFGSGSESHSEMDGGLGRFGSSSMRELSWIGS